MVLMQGDFDNCTPYVKANAEAFAPASLVKYLVTGNQGDRYGDVLWDVTFSQELDGGVDAHNARLGG